MSSWSGAFCFLSFFLACFLRCFLESFFFLSLGCAGSALISGEITLVLATSCSCPSTGFPCSPTCLGSSRTEASRGGITSASAADATTFSRICFSNSSRRPVVDTGSDPLDDFVSLLDFSSFSPIFVYRKPERLLGDPVSDSRPGLSFGDADVSANISVSAKTGSGLGRRSDHGSLCMARSSSVTGAVAAIASRDDANSDGNRRSIDGAGDKSVTSVNHCKSS